jgi:hypothetical protein
MEFTVFWSWQSDAPRNCNLKFIRDALDKAIEEINKENKEISLKVDSGMENVAGTPDVAQIMFDKIDKSEVIVCDVSLVGRIDKWNDNGVEKKIPNPNVMIEMGYAAGRMGWENVICVMNEFYGTKADLPFDVKSKRHPVDYTLDPEDLAQAKSVKRELSKCLKKAIQCCIDAEHRAVIDALSRMDILCLTVCSFFGELDYFPDLSLMSPDKQKLMSSSIDVAGFRLAIQRLIDLGMLRCKIHDNQMYAYHWTYRGKRLLDELKKKDAFQEPPAVSITQPNV